MKKINWNLIMGALFGVSMVVPISIIAYNSFKQTQQSQTQPEQPIIQPSTENHDVLKLIYARYASGGVVWLYVRVSEVEYVYDHREEHDYSSEIKIFTINQELTNPSGYYDEWKDECIKANLIY